LLKYFFYGASFCEIAPLKFSEHQLLQSAFRLLCTTIILQDLKTRGDGIFGLNKAEAITSIPNFTVAHMLFADDLSLTPTDHNDLQTMLNKLRVYAQKKPLTVNT
jgi:hypothetical protein